MRGDWGAVWDSSTHKLAPSTRLGRPWCPNRQILRCFLIGPNGSREQFDDVSYANEAHDPQETIAPLFFLRSDWLGPSVAIFTTSANWADFSGNQFPINSTFNWSKNNFGGEIHISKGLDWAFPSLSCNGSWLQPFSDSWSWQSFVSPSCHVFNCLFPLDVPNEYSCYQDSSVIHGWFVFWG